VITLVDGVCGTVEVHRQRRYRESSVQHSGEVDWTMQLTAVHSRQQLNPSDTHVRQPLATEHTACHTHTHTMHAHHSPHVTVGWLVGVEFLMPHSTQYRSFWRRSSQPITGLILTNKTVQENTDKKTQYKSEKVNNLKYSKQNYPGSVASYNTRPGNEVGLFYNAPAAHTGLSTSLSQDHRTCTHVKQLSATL